MQDPIPMFFLPGDRVAALFGFFWHVGIVTGRSIFGQVMVISSSKRHGRVVEETLEQFSGGRPVRNEGFTSHLPRGAVVAMARQRIGQPWTLFRNCEHVASEAEGRQASSPQLLAWGLAGLLLFAATRRSA